MVVGNGAIAKIFVNFKNDNYIIFASGVSNSLEIDENEFKREENLLKKIIKECPNKVIIYFSTVSVYTKKTKYTAHKLNIEKILKNNSNYLIIRIPQLISKEGNKKNLINFLIEAIKNDKKIFLEKETERSIIDIEDLKSITEFIVEKKIKNKIYNLSGFEFIKITKIVNIIENFLNKKAIKILIDKSSKIYKHNSFIFRKKELNLKNNGYIENTILKYLSYKKNFK